jgi:DNA-nicking Smr family endonuclease
MTRPTDEEALALFRSAAAGAVPLKQPARADSRREQDDPASLQRRRAAAVLDPRPDPNPLSTDVPMQFGPYDPLEFRRDGVQYGVFRKLKQGGYALESRLDLHRMTVEQARTALFQFIHDCLANDLRTVLVLHGKGERSETPARLKNCVAHWLKALDAVQAYASAQPQHGGSGAVYVLLRKSERSREQTRRQFR